MAKGRKCPNCGTPMFAEREENQPKGRWVYYACQNKKCKSFSENLRHGFKEKVFEEYADKQ